MIVADFRKNKKMSNEINFCAVCPMASCTRNAQCVRYANYLKAKNEEDSYQVLNFDRISYDADKGCSHFLVWEKQRWAKGFRRMFRTMPVCNTHYFWTRTPYLSESSYCRAKRGALLIDPNMQSALLKVFERNGADISIGFDEYVMQDILVEG